jgi:hypothetical protein
VASKKVIVEFGFSQTDELVKVWLEKQGIDQALVRAYRVTRGVNEIPTIELTMFYTEEKVAD